MSDCLADEIERVLVVMGGDLSAPEWAGVLGVDLDDVRAAFERLRPPDVGVLGRRARPRAYEPIALSHRHAREAAAAHDEGESLRWLAVRYGVDRRTMARAVRWAREAA